MLLAKAAADILRARDSLPAHVAVGAVTLAEAIRQGIAVPLDATALLWLAVQRSPTASWAADATEAVGILADRSVVETIVTSITGQGGSRELRRMGLDALASPTAATHVTDGELLHLVEVARGREANQVGAVIVGASEARTIPQHIVRAIVQRWSEQPDATTRMAVLEIVGLLPRDDAARTLAGLLLSDPFAKVRELAVLHVEDVLDPDGALVLLERALAEEQHRDVRAELERGRNELIASGGDASNGEHPRKVVATSP